MSSVFARFGKLYTAHARACAISGVSMLALLNSPCLLLALDVVVAQPATSEVIRLRVPLKPR
jgi:hypothetical protein